MQVELQGTACVMTVSSDAIMNGHDEMTESSDVICTAYLDVNTITAYTFLSSRPMGRTSITDGRVIISLSLCLDAVTPLGSSFFGRVTCLALRPPAQSYKGYR